MLRFAIRRAMLALPLVALVVVVTFAIMEIVPGDAADVLAGTGTTLSAEEIRAQLGLDQPLPERFAEYVAGAVQGDFGTSITVASGRPVSGLIIEALWVTMSLAAVTLVMVALMGIPLGIVAALRRGSLLDRAVTFASSVAMSIPTFVIGLFLIIGLALRAELFPATGYVSTSEGWWPWLEHLLLPAFALSLASAGEVARQVRSSIVNALDEDYVRTARAKGLSESRILRKHIGKGIGIPVVTVLGIQAERVIAGTVVVESLFNLHGLGFTAVDATFNRDFRVVQGVVLVSTVFVIIINVLVDVSYAYFQPKLRATS